MNQFSRLLRNERGGALVEFVLAAPVFLTFVFGASQLGSLFLADAGLKNAVSEGARLASVYPMPSDEDIIEAVTSSHFPLVSTEVEAEPSVTHGTENGTPYVEISMSYNVPIDLVFYNPPDVTLTETRRVYTQPIQVEEEEEEEPPVSTSSGAASSTSTGGDSSTSSSASGGTSTSTGGDTSTSTGGTTTTSTGGSSTTSTSTSSTSTSASSSGNNGNGNGNGSSGNGNGSSSTSSTSSTSSSSGGGCKKKKC